MNDREFNAQRKRLTALQAKWGANLGMGWWRTNHVYHRGQYELNGTASGEALASCQVRWEYRLATIEWNMDAVLDASDETLEEAFVHECAHALVNEMREWVHPDSAMPHEEHVVSGLTNAFLWVYKAGKKAK